jgi:hypothetical protein
MKTIISIILTLVLFYLALSFVVLDLNFKNWTEGMRLFYALFSVPFATIVYAFLRLEGE